jgi:hypothetical protein
MFEDIGNDLNHLKLAAIPQKIANFTSEVESALKLMIWHKSYA